MSTVPQPVSSSTVPMYQRGRSNKPQVVKTAVVQRNASGQSIRSIAKDLSISINTVKRILAEYQVDNAAKLGTVEQAMQNAGVTLDVVAGKLKSQLDASDTQLAAKDGIFTDERNVPNHSARNKAVEMAAKILGMFPDESATVQAQLFVKLPDRILAAGHSPTCMCETCVSAWEQRALPAATVLPESP